MIDVATVRAERLRRQGLAAPIEREADYEALFRRLQPVSTPPEVRPGSPPRLVHRTCFDDAKCADGLRAARRLVKVRLQGGVGYLHTDDLGLYGNAFARPLERPNAIQRRVFDAVRTSGPLTPRQLAEETGLLNKQVMPALHRLQEAFLVYEDQIDDSWERGFYEFASEWDRVEIGASLADPALDQVLTRFLHAHVFATEAQMRDWSRLPVRRLRESVSRLRDAGQLHALALETLGAGFVLTADRELAASAPDTHVLMLHRQDFLVRASASELAGRFGKREILQFLLIDGRLAGAVRGHWRFGPYDVDDVSVELAPAQQQKRRSEILAAVGAEYHPPQNELRGYAGQPLSQRAARAAYPT